jgi:hypothetical protein
MGSLNTHFQIKRKIMDDTGARVIELIFGRWRSQILYTGVKLGVFDALVRGPANAVHVARDLGVDAGMLYRLMRALGSLELLKEDNNRTFSLTPRIVKETSPCQELSTAKLPLSPEALQESAEPLP